MSNEVILCIWDNLSSGDVIYSFSDLNTRIDSLLLEFHGLYKELDLRYCSLSACRFLCRQVPTMIEWRLGLTVLKLGNRYRSCQIDFLVAEISKLIVIDHLSREEKSCKNLSHDMFRVLMTYPKHIEPIFPKLNYFSILPTRSISDECRDVLLYGVASGSSLRRFIWNACSNQTHHSTSFFDWLFKYSIDLVSCQLRTPSCEDGFQLTYEHTSIHNYVPHQSLIYLTVNILNLNTLYVLLHYLPQLQYLDVYISNVIDENDQNLATKLNYLRKIRVFNIRLVKISGRDCSHLDQLLNKFSNTLEKFSLCLIHFCNGEIDHCFNGHHLATLCSKLSSLRSLNFAIRGQLIKLSNRQILSDFIETFRTPFWLLGPLGSIRVCVYYDEIFGFIEMFSLPYTFCDTTLFITIDLINVLFNTKEEKLETSDNLSVSVGPLWYGMRWLLIALVKNQKIPMSFIHALQYCNRQGKVLVLSQERGFMSNKIEDHMQLTHFTKLQLNGWIDDNSNYHLEQLIDWLRLLPKIRCLYIDSTELKYWFTNNCSHPYLDTFLQRLDRLYVDCSSIVNINQNEEFLIQFLSFVIDKHRFPRLLCLRLIECKHIHSSWSNISKWIDFILTRINEHQLECLRFDFIEKEHELPDINPHDETITIIESSYVVNIHRLVLDNHISFWIERIQK